MAPTPIASEAAPQRPQHINRLAREKSPYLLQHAHNPVDWYPWGEEAFAKARTENKPIFLSIGYSTCHWCHVMAHESFEDEATAAIMNRDFVNIKVDREERPDVDRVYMTFVQATSGHGGWPLSAWLTPELQPFIGGTYFPPEDRFGQPGFRKVLANIVGAWRDQREKLLEHGARIIDALRESAAQKSHGRAESAALERAYEQLERTYDEREGGFGHAPKFPRPSVLNFLLRYSLGDADTASSKRSRQMVLNTLDKMATGGMHDHLGGGFHRYSVDEFWHVPHFEKMLYDQAQLALAYLEAFQVSRRPDFENTARSILDYVERDLRSPGGGFFSAEDADSYFEHGKAGHGEGAFYVWTRNELAKTLGAEAEIFCYRYGVTEKGNVRPGSDPHHEFDGKNVLFTAHSLDEVAAHFQIHVKTAVARLAAAKAKLFALRNERPRPHLDDKIIAAWNGLMISAFARAGQVLHDPHYAEIATGAAAFLRWELFDAKRGALARSFREGRSAVEGFADDYAFVIQGLIDLYETAFDVEWLKFALRLQETLDAKFFDNENGGYFTTGAGDPRILLRLKEDNDGAEPAASSVAAVNLIRLAEIFDDAAMRQRARQTIDAFASQLSHFPTAMPQMLVALEAATGTRRQIVIAGTLSEPATRDLLREVRSHYLPDTIVLLADGAEGQKFLAEKNQALGSMQSVEGRPAAYVCQHFTCAAPVTEVAALRDLITTSR